MEEDITTKTAQSYRFAAAVLSSFDSELLQPVEQGHVDDGEAVLELLEECERVQVAPEEWRWMLKNSVRRETLTAMGTREVIRQALQANTPRPDDPLQRMFEAYIEQSAPPIEQQSATDLMATLQVADWLEGVLDNLPAREALINRLEWQQLLEPFRQLVGDHFRGRRKELTDLGHFFLTGEQHRSIYKARPLMIFGPGGVGKSTLVAKFILETVDNPAVEHFAFCYWDFDRATLLPEAPVTLLAELALQLGLQFPPLKAQAQALRQRWLNQLSESVGAGRGIGQRGSKIYRELAQRSIQEDRGDLSFYLVEFKKLLDELPFGQDIRLLLVLDTFERVQEISFEFTRALWDFLNEVQRIFPWMRVIVSGRAPLSEEIAHQPYELSALDEEAAKGYLAYRGVSHPKLADAIFQRVGGDPLSLHLIVNSLRQEHNLADLMALPDDFDELTIDHELNQGWLYRRYLNRIQDPEIRRLAHPGLVLRRITPALIREVLALPCKVDVPSDEVAGELFERLAQQASLVIREGPKTLRHRPDVRKRMLRGLVQTEGPAVYEIHRRAQEFYAQQPPTPEARAEELYHRLCLTRPREELDARWLPEVAKLLRDAVDEIPLEMRGYLISKLQITSLTFDWNEADAQSKEAFVATRVQDALVVNQLAEALRLLGDVRDRLPGSPLYRLEAQALERLGRYAEARIVANEGLFSARKAGNVALELDLLLIAIRANETLGQYERARALLDDAEGLNPGLEEPSATVLRLEWQMHRLRLCRLDPANCDADLSTLRQTTYEALDPRFEALARQNSTLLLDVVEEIGVKYSDIVARMVALFPAAFEAENNQRQIVGLLQEWQLALRGRRTLSQNTLVRIAELIQSGVQTQSNDWPDLFRNLLHSHMPTQPLVSGLVRLVRDTHARAQQPQTVSMALLGQIATALFSTFETRDTLMAFLKDEFPNESVQVNWETIYSDLLLDVATLFERQGKSESLVERALTHQPDNTLLVALQQELTAPASHRSPEDRLTSDKALIPSHTFNPSISREQQVAALPKGMPPFTIGAYPVDVEGVFNWALGMRQAMWAVCRVEMSQATATGFLVAPNLLLTINPLHYGIESPDWSGARFRFDYRVMPDARTIHTGIIYRPAVEWVASMNKDRFYTLIPLEGMPGLDLVPGESITRGWLSLSSAPFDPNQGVFMLHHGDQGPQKLEYAAANQTSEGEIYLTNVSGIRQPGSSGAPCFNEAWEVVAFRIGIASDFKKLMVLWTHDLLTDPLFAETINQYLPDANSEPQLKF